MRDAQAAYWQAAQQVHSELVAAVQAPVGAHPWRSAMARTEQTSHARRAARASAAAPRSAHAPHATIPPPAPTPVRQTVLVLQGGGALGAYQVGVYQALHERGIEPDWVIGTSIGAINGALIAGNPPEHRTGSAARVLGSRRARVAHRGVAAVAGPGQLVQQSAHGVARHPELLHAQPGVVGRHAGAARRRGGLVLQHGAAACDARRRWWTSSCWPSAARA